MSKSRENSALSISRLKKMLDSKELAVTGEIAPPRGANPSSIIEKTKLLNDYCDAVNIPDNILGVPSMSSVISAHYVIKAGGEPIVHITGRDRNRISIIGELYGAHAVGVRNILFVTGDRHLLNSNSDTKMVFDIDSIQALKIADGLTEGHDPAGNDLDGFPKFYLGATFNPYASPLEVQIQRTRRKHEAGAMFFQTQAVFDAAVLETFMEHVQDMNLKVLAGIIPLKGPKRAEFINRYVPGVTIPVEMIKRLKRAGKGLKDEKMLEAQREEGLLMAEDLIKAVKKIKGIHGVHLMAIGWEESIPILVQRAGLYPRPAVR